MTKNEAIKQLNLGYLIFILGILFGILIPQTIKEEIVSSSLIWGYLFWSYYWGYKIIKSISINTSHPSVTIETRDIYSYFIMNIRLLFYSVIFKFIFSIIIGVIGGALFKQVQLSKTAYF